jgi:hypothetical protein
MGSPVKRFFKEGGFGGEPAVPGEYLLIKKEKIVVRGLTK